MEDLLVEAAFACGFNRSMQHIFQFAALERIRNNDGLGGRNETYKIGARPVVPRKGAACEVMKAYMTTFTLFKYTAGNTFATIPMAARRTT